MLLIACLLTLICPGTHTRFISVSEAYLVEFSEEEHYEIFDLAPEEREEIGAAQVFKRIFAILTPLGTFLNFFSSVIISNFHRQTNTRWWFSNGMTNAP